MIVIKEICKHNSCNINLAFNSLTRSDNLVSFEIVGNIGDKRIYQYYDNYTNGIIEYNRIINK